MSRLMVCAVVLFGVCAAVRAQPGEKPTKETLLKDGVEGSKWRGTHKGGTVELTFRKETVLVYMKLPGVEVIGNTGYTFDKKKNEIKIENAVATPADGTALTLSGSMTFGLNTYTLKDVRLERADSAPAGAPTADQKKATATYILALERTSGGFAAAKGDKSNATVPATFAAVHALAYFGGEIKDKKACGKFVLGCRDTAKKGFAPTPGGAVDAATTALAALTLVELRGAGTGGVVITINSDWGSYAMRSSTNGAVGDNETMDAVIDALIRSERKTLDDHRRFGEVYRSASRFGTIQLFAKDDVLAALKKQANADGTFGKGDSVVADTAAAVSAVRDLRGDLDKAGEVVKILKSAQRADGGWGKEKSDLDATRRVVRALTLLKGDCDAAACRKFVAKCRNEDGGYGNEPGRPSDIQATYHAADILQQLGNAGTKP